jgi:hypothetical protein
MAMTNLIQDRQKFNRQIIDFYADCQHKNAEQHFDTASMEYVNVCSACKQQII